jgi:hypothetical protein
VQLNLKVQHLTNKSPQLNNNKSSGLGLRAMHSIYDAYHVAILLTSSLPDDGAILEFGFRTYRRL